MCGVSTEVDQLVPALLTDWIEQNENEINEVLIKRNRITQQNCPE